MFNRVPPDPFDERCFLFQIFVESRDITSDHGAGDRKRKLRAGSYCHYLNVFSPSRTVSDPITLMQPLLDSEDQPLNRA